MKKTLKILLILTLTLPLHSCEELFETDESQEEEYSAPERSYEGSSYSSEPEASESEPDPEPQLTKCSRCRGSGRCNGCGGTLRMICPSHDTNGDGYCDDCDNIGMVKCYGGCGGTGACHKCDGEGYY